MTISNYQCNVENPQTCLIILDYAKLHGWSGSMYASKTYPDTYFWLFFDPRTKTVDGSTNRDENKNMPVVSIPECIKKIQDAPMNTVMDFEIEGEEVIVYQDGSIRVGCTTVNSVQVEKIIAEITKFMKDENDR